MFWCKFISDGVGSEELARFAEHNGMTQELKMAEQAYNEIKVTEEERAWAYHLSMDRAEVDYRNEILLSMEEAREKATEEKAISSARNLLTMQVLTHGQIAKAVELPIEKIEELAAEMSAK